VSIAAKQFLQPSEMREQPITQFEDESAQEIEVLVAICSDDLMPQ
jgi:hypothetical protein